MGSPHPLRVLVVDLNNFARYPTIAVGYLVAPMRAAGMEVEVFCPLSVGVRGLPREPREHMVRHWARRANFTLHRSQHRVVQHIGGAVDALRRRVQQRRWNRIVRTFAAWTATCSYDVVLISAYLMYHSVCRELAQLCDRRRIPLLIGSSYFAQDEVAMEWLRLRGVTAVVGGEVEHYLCDIVRAAASGGPLDGFPGVWPATGSERGRRGPAPPLHGLDALPFPDYRDFPWSAYPNRIVPIITGRGCGWGVCAFCSDVTSSAGRTYRSRSPENVLAELEHQGNRHDARLFVFTDLKLNSNLEVWYALLAQAQARLRGAAWIGAVHVGAKQPNGLSRADLIAARRAGMCRLTTGLESGSQRVLDVMRKGTDLNVTERFIRDAKAAGISVRVTMIHGYPGERAEDVVESAKLLERHVGTIDRVMLNRFQMMLGPALHREYVRQPEAIPSVRNVRLNVRLALLSHDYVEFADPDYHRATVRLLNAVHAINRRRLEANARQFEGVM